MLDASKEIRQRGAVKLLKKDLVRLTDLIQEMEDLIEVIKDHRKVMGGLLEELKKELKILSNTLKELGKSLNLQGK